jgi:signal transduction histidine kinase
VLPYGRFVSISAQRFPDRPRPSPVLLAAVLVVFVTGVTTGISHWHGHPLGVVGYLLLVGGAVPLVFRRQHPLLAFVACSAVVCGYYVLGFPTGPNVLYVLAALAWLAYRSGPAVAGSAALGLAVVVEVLALVLRPFNPLDPRLLVVPVVLLALVTSGTAVRARRDAVRERRQRGAEAVLRRAEEQRLAIAREVHDVVAHSLAMINVQAGVGAHVADRRPEQAKAALVAIKEASRTALADLRATVDVLRSGEALAPTQGLDRLPDLVESAGAAGLAVSTSGSAGDLPAPVDVAAYRIIQESLTNVVRHAHQAAAVRITLDRDPAELRITVRDDGRGPYPDGPGNGLRGMAERAQALGGEASAGPAPIGGFEVRARLPVTVVGEMG